MNILLLFCGKAACAYFCRYFVLFIISGELNIMKKHLVFENKIMILNINTIIEFYILPMLRRGAFKCMYFLF